MTDSRELSSVLTSWGVIRIEYDQTGVIGCALPRLLEIPNEPFAILEAGVDLYSIYVRELFEGGTPVKTAIGHLEGTRFQKHVWQGLLEIPIGETRSYKKLAEQIGCGSACRAVANACGRNPIPLFIPCHRVIRSDGNPGGFSSGTAWKRLLLAVEQRNR